MDKLKISFLIFCLISNLIQHTKAERPSHPISSPLMSAMYNPSNYSPTPLSYQIYSRGRDRFYPATAEYLNSIYRESMVFLIPDCEKKCSSNNVDVAKWTHLAAVLSKMNESHIVLVQWYFDQSFNEYALLSHIADLFFRAMKEMMIKISRIGDIQNNFIVSGKSINVVANLLHNNFNGQMPVDIIVDALCPGHTSVPIDVSKLTVLRALITGHKECKPIPGAVNYTLGSSRFNPLDIIIAANADIGYVYFVPQHKYLINSKPDFQLYELDEEDYNKKFVDLMPPTSLKRKPRVERRSSSIEMPSFNIKKVVSGSMSQYDLGYKKACIAHVVMSIAMSQQLILSKWTSVIIDDILTEGDNYFGDSIKKQKTRKIYNQDELNQSFELGDCKYDIKSTDLSKSTGDYGFALDLVVAALVKYFSDPDSNFTSGVFIAREYAVAIFKRKAPRSEDLIYYLFDSHKRGSDGLISDDKPTAVLLRFDTLTDLAQVLVWNLNGSRQWDGTRNSKDAFTITPLVLEKKCEGDRSRSKDDKRRSVGRD